MQNTDRAHHEEKNGAGSTAPNGASSGQHHEIPPDRPTYRFSGELPPALEPLRARKQWLTWDYVYNEKKEKWDKPPRSAHTGRLASINNPANLGTFAEAAATAAREGLAGVGYLLIPDDDLTGIDLDDCISDSGSYSALAAEIISYAETYTETSPSGQGIRLFAQGKIAKAFTDKASGVEVYGTGRYLTVTGLQIEGTPSEIRPAPHTLGKLTAIVEAAQGAKRAKANGKGTANGKTQAGGDTFWDKVNAAALANLGAWVPALHPTAHKQPNGAWRVTSADFKRDLQEDLAYHPNGIRDHGEEEGHTPIDAVLKYGTPANVTEAAAWLCQRLGVEPASLGFRKAPGPNGHTQARADGDRGPAVQGHDTDAWPDPVQLPQGLLPVAPFDYDMLPEKVRPWVEDICERMQCPADFVAVSVMAVLGSLIGRRMMVRPKRQDNWSEVPNQWALLIGRPGVMKSPAIEEALWPVKVLSEAARKRLKLAMAEYEAKSAAAQARGKNAQKEVVKRLAKDKSAAIEDLLKPQPGEEEPTLQRYIATNASYEALAVLLQQNPQGLLVHRDEMLSFLDRLAEEGHADERGFYLTGWAGNSAYTFDRIGRGLDLHIDAVCLSLLGSTQPGRISKYIVDVLRGGRGDDGLMQRFGLMVWPDIPATWRNVDRKPNVEARTEAFAVFKALDNLDWKAVHAQRDLGADERVVGLPWLRFSEAANERFVAWLTGLELRLRGHEELALESHLAKYRKLVPGLALICHLADGAKGEVSDAAVEKALKWAVYLETHAARTYASTTIAAADAARAIIGKVKSGHLKMQFAPREIVRAQWSRLKGSDTIQRALQLLEDHDWLTINKVVTGGRPGTVCNMNPKAMAFAKTHLGGN